MLRVLSAKAVGMQEDLQAPPRQILPPHLLGRTRGVGGDGLFHLIAQGDGAAEGARGHDALAVRRDVFEPEARRPAQLVHHAFDDDAHALSDEPRIGAAKIERRCDADCFQTPRYSIRDTQRSVNSISASAASCVSAVSSKATPPESGSFFALRLAALASVLVGAIPTETGMPVHCRVVARSSRVCVSNRCSKPERRRNASSIE